MMNYINPHTPTCKVAFWFGERGGGGGGGRVHIKKNKPSIEACVKIYLKIHDFFDYIHFPDMKIMNRD